MRKRPAGESLVTPQRLRLAINIVLVAGATLFVIWNLRPGLWFDANTPTGGDLGAHVWSPAYLRDVLLPAGRLTGWSPDWYAGFPAFSFYMVVPSLLIVAVDVGLPVLLWLPVLVVIAAATTLLLMRLRPEGTRIAWICGIAGGLAALLVGVDYGVAIKLVVVAGMVTLPAAAFAAGRMGGFAFPGPAAMAVMTLPFLFDRSYNIYGGNVMSTMAGEFAFSLALTLAVLYMGVAAKGIATGRHRGSAAVLLALAGLTHLFAAFLALVFTAALWVSRPGTRSTHWVALTGGVGALISAFWVLPFAWNRSLLNDMGWGKEHRYVEALWSRSGEFGDQSFLVNDPPLQIFVAVACIGVVVFVLRRVRFAMALAITAAVFALAFLYLPEGRLWNVRLLPFYYLSVYLLAGLTVAEAGRWFAGAFSWSLNRRSQRWVPLGVAAPVLVGTLIMVVSLGLPLRALPGGSLDEASGRYSWLGLSTTELNLGPAWVNHNFTGYEGAAAWGEYSSMVATMEQVGAEHGCGRALWEYESARLGSYGTPMAPMLLPYWTDGCIGSMEGLYFEASATTPYHFLLQSELSAQPSRAQRDLPYSELDVASGAGHLQDLGVRYYMAFSEAAVAQGRAEPRLVEIASDGPWVVFAVAESDPVVALDHLPVVVDGIGAGGEDWLVPTAAHWQADNVPLLAAAGPAWWPTLSIEELEALADPPESDLPDGADPSEAAAALPDDRSSRIRRLAEALPAVLPRAEVAPAEVSDVELDRFSISFEVSQPGAPVLIRTSWFPNWSASGAEGPYRVAPNLMAVVPTSTEVTLTFGRSAVEIIGILATLVGLGLLFVIGGVRPPEQERRLWDFVPDAVLASGWAEVRELASRGTLSSHQVDRLDQKARQGTLEALIVGGCGMIVTVAVALAVLVWGAPTEDVISSLALLVPGVIAFGAVLFWAVPRYFLWRHFRLAVIPPARLLVELGEGGDSEAPRASSASDAWNPGDGSAAPEAYGDVDPDADPYA